MTTLPTMRKWMFGVVGAVTVLGVVAVVAVGRYSVCSQL